MSDKTTEVKDYYGKVIKQTSDLKTDACCTFEKPPQYIVDALQNLHPEIIKTYYGCGIIIPDCLKDLTILDLGCGTGHDVYLLSQFVGEQGTVIGVDMTDEQLKIAIDHEDYHKQKFGYTDSNTQFIKGYIEDLTAIGNNSIDLVISNCVVNLSKEKEKVLREIHRVLKEGGEFYFSDIYSSRRVSQKLQDDPVLWGECLSGAMYWNDFIHMTKWVGFSDPRLVKDKKVEPKNKELEKKLVNIEFYSATYRLFKLSNLDLDCENYGQKVTYLGTIPNNDKEWKLDNHHIFKTNIKYDVCGNTFQMLSKTRFKKHFSFKDNDVHTGIFPDCGKCIPFESAGKKSCGTSCC